MGTTDTGRIIPHLEEGLAVHADRAPEDSAVAVYDDAVVVVTQAYSHKGHSLIEVHGPQFFGHSGVKVRVKAVGVTQDVILSPIHGHHERSGGDGLPNGVRCSVRCPVSNEELPEYMPCPCGEGTLRTIFLTPDLNKAHVAAICDVWGCQQSRIVDAWEILSEFVRRETADEDDDE